MTTSAQISINIRGIPDNHGNLEDALNLIARAMVKATEEVGKLALGHFDSISADCCYQYDIHNTPT